MGKVYCKDCAKWMAVNCLNYHAVIVRGDAEWANGTPNIFDGACLVPIDTRDTPTRSITVYADLHGLNANNDCPHYELKPPKEEPPEKEPWWKFWR